MTSSEQQNHIDEKKSLLNKVWSFRNNLSEDTKHIIYGIFFFWGIASRQQAVKYDKSKNIEDAKQHYEQMINTAFDYTMKPWDVPLHVMRDLWFDMSEENQNLFLFYNNIQGGTDLYPWHVLHFTKDLKREDKKTISWDQVKALMTSKVSPDQSNPQLNEDNQPVDEEDQ